MGLGDSSCNVRSLIDCLRSSTSLRMELNSFSSLDISELSISLPLDPELVVGCCENFLRMHNGQRYRVSALRAFKISVDMPTHAGWHHLSQTLQ